MATYRIVTLDGVRGYAALVVVLYHAILDFDLSQISDPLRIPVQNVRSWYGLWEKLWLATFNGECAVILFFLLSGCVLIGTIERGIDRFPLPLAATAFAVRRIFRIFPALIVCILVIAAAMWGLSLALGNAVKPYETVEVLNNLRLYRLAVHGASWTLRVEILAVPYLLVTGLLFHYLRTEGLFVSLIFALLAYDNWWLVFGFPDLAQNLIYFTLGCMIPTGIGLSCSKATNYLRWPVTLMAFLYLRHFFPYASVTALLMQGMFGFLFLCQVYHTPSPRLAKFLSRPTSIFLGRISYSFYLWNVLFLNLLFSLRPYFPAAWPAHPVEAGLASSALIIVATIPLSQWSQHFVEIPGNYVGHALSRYILQLWHPRSVAAPSSRIEASALQELRPHEDEEQLPRSTGLE